MKSYFLHSQDLTTPANDLYRRGRFVGEDHAYNGFAGMAMPVKIFEYKKHSVKFKVTDGS